MRKTACHCGKLVAGLLKGHETMGQFDDDKGTIYYCQVNKVYCGTKYRVILYANAFYLNAIQLLLAKIYSQLIVLNEIMLKLS